MERSKRYTEQADVIVLGFGGAGAVAAITAHDAGAKVIILEKQPADTVSQTNHTPNTRMSGGNWLCPTDLEKTKQYLEAMVRVSNETLDAERQEIISVFSSYLLENTGWMRGIGAQMATAEQMKYLANAIAGSGPQRTVDGGLIISDFPELPAADCSCIYSPYPIEGYKNGAAFFKLLQDAVNKRRIEVLWETPGEHLVSENGRIKGVVARHKGKAVMLSAKRGVVLACGGFEFNHYMKENYLKVNPCYFTGSPANTGDGINMALEAGAALWHMNSASWRAVMKFPESPLAFATQHHATAGIFVDKMGKRFCNERYRLHTFGYNLINFDNALFYPRVPFYWIFDEKRRAQLGPLASQSGACGLLRGTPDSGLYTWSQDNLVEIDRGWILKAGALEDLAGQIKAGPDNNGLMQPSVLRQTVRTYNRYCRKGNDADFQRPEGSLSPLEDPPYYAVKLWPGGPNTQGGPRRNTRAQVLRPDNSPVPGLYAAGELGSVWSMIYQGGGNLGECIAFGRIAGDNAASEKPG